jgi:hypothetical protein
MSLKEENKTISTLDVDEDIQDYIFQLGEKEKIAYKIAMDHLGTSFSLKKSIGYKEWKKKCIQNQINTNIKTNSN